MWLALGLIFAACAVLLLVSLLLGYFALTNDTGTADGIAIVTCIREDSSLFFRVYSKAMVVLMLGVGVFVFCYYLIPATYPVAAPFAKIAALTASFAVAGLLFPFVCGQIAFRFSLRLATRVAAASGRSENEATLIAVRAGLITSVLSLVTALLLVAGGLALLLGVFPAHTTHTMLPLIGLPFGAAVMAFFAQGAGATFNHASKLTERLAFQHADSSTLYVCVCVSCAWDGLLGLVVVARWAGPR